MTATNPDGTRQEVRYDAARTLTLVQDELGRQTTWTHDARGLAVTKTDAAGLSEGFSRGHHIA